MIRLSTLASVGLFATGLAIFPVSVFAQPNAATGVEKKAPVAAPMAGHDTKPIAAGKEALGKDAAKPAPIAKDAAKSGIAKDGIAKDGTAKATTNVGTNAGPNLGTNPGASTGTPAKVGG
ncbi:MAG: hypothetical protein WCI94_06105 [Rhodospirillales bacterium]